VPFTTVTYYEMPLQNFCLVQLAGEHCWTLTFCKAHEIVYMTMKSAWKVLSVRGIPTRCIQHPLCRYCFVGKVIKSL
jgi:hypothetical protein